MNRRHFFKAFAGSASVAIAGCTGGNNKTSEDIEVLEAGAFGSPGERFIDFNVKNVGESGRFEFTVEMSITEGDKKGETDKNSRVVFLSADEATEVSVATSIPGVGSSGRPSYEFEYTIQRTKRPLSRISVSSKEVRLNQEIVFEPTDVLVSEGGEISKYEWNINGEVFRGQVVSDGEIQRTKKARYSPFHSSDGEMVNEVEHGLWVHLTVTDDEGRTGSASEKLDLRYSLAGEDLRQTDFIFVDDMSEVNLEGRDLTEHSFSHVDLSGANLKDTNLSRTYMIEANLKGADLRGANLAYAELKNANFQNADLRGATISSRAEGADFTNATWSDGSTCSTKSCDGQAY